MKNQVFGLVIVTAMLTSSFVLANCDYNPECHATPSYTPCCVGLNGFYIGGNIGVDSPTTYLTITTTKNFGNIGKTFLNTNISYGLQAGYDWNCGHSLFGLIADFNSANIKSKHSSTTPNAYKIMFDRYATFRGRFGFISPGNCLFYVTAGAALARLETKFIGLYYPFDHTIRKWKAHGKWGWSAGLGLEYLLKGNWSLGVDLLYMNFANKTYYSTYPEGTLIATRADSVWVFRTLVNYHLGNLFKFLSR